MLLGDSNPFDELAPVSRSVRREWNALDTAYQKCSSLLLKGIEPDSYAISGISSKLAQYLSAVRRQRLAIGRGEARLLQRLVTMLRRCVEQSDRCNAVAIAAYGNALKAAAEARLFENEPAQLKHAYAGWFGKISGRHFDKAEAQAISNVGNALKAGLDAQIIDKSMPACSAAYQRLMLLANSAAFASAAPQNIANLFNSLRAAVYADVLSGDQTQVLRATLHHTVALLTSTLTSANVQNLSNVLKSVVFFHKHGLLDTATVVHTVQAVLATLNSVTAQQTFPPISRAMVLTSLAGFYTKLAGTQTRRRAADASTGADVAVIDPFLEGLLPQLLAHIQSFPVAQITGDDRLHLRRFGLACQELYRFLDRSKRRRAHASPAQAIHAVLREQIVPRQHALAQEAASFWLKASQHDRAASVSTVNMLELMLISIYRPDLKLTLPFPPQNPAQMRAITAQSFAALDHALERLPSRPVRIPVLDLRGRPVGKHSLDSSLFQAMSAHRWPSPVLMKIDHQVKAECLPVFARHEGQLYRFDVFGGSKLKPDLVREDYGMLIGIPVEAVPFFNQEWLTSKEAYVYAQRALMPETPGTVGQPFANRGLAGRIALGIVPDAQARQLALTRGDYGVFQIRDGCGFIKASVAALAGLASQHASTPAALRPAHLPTQALQYYRLSTPGKAYRGRDGGRCNRAGVAGRCQGQAGQATA